MEQDDEEFEQLLGEIPRATSAPPHLEELQRAYGAELNDSTFAVSVGEGGRTLPPVKPFIDIRCDEQYEDFYRAYSGAKKLPPPMENRSLYVEFPNMMSPKSNSAQVSPFFSSLAIDSPRTMAGLRPRQKQQEAQISVNNNSTSISVRTSSPPPDHHHPSKSSAPVDNRSLGSAFGNLSLAESSGGGLSVGQQREENGIGVDSRGAANGGLDHGVVVGSSMSNGRGAPISSGLYSHLSPFSSGFGSEPASLVEAFANRPSMELFSQKNAGSMSMAVPSNNGAYGTLEGFDGQAAQAFEKYVRRSSPTGMENQVYSSSTRPSKGGMMDGFGTSSTAAQVAHQQQHFESAYAAAMAAARIIHPGISSQSVNGNDLYSNTGVDYNAASARALAQQAHRIQFQLEAEQRARERQYNLQQQMQHQHMQHQQMRFYTSLQAHANGVVGSGSNSDPSSRGHSPTGTATRQASLHQAAVVSATHLKNSRNHEQLWNNMRTGFASQSNGDASRNSTVNSICRYNAQGYCSRGDACPFIHTAAEAFGSGRGTSSSNFKESSRDERLLAEKGFPRSRVASRAAMGTAIAAASAVQRRKLESISNGNLPSMNGHVYANGNHHAPSAGFHSDLQNHKLLDETLEFDGTRHQILGAQHLGPANQQPKYNTLEEVEGRIFSIAKDQHGCRFLQRKFDEGGPEDVQKIFNEIIDHIIELMTDPFGNYLVQKLLEVCDEAQRMEILHVVTGKGELVTISLNMHGTRAVQKLIETLKTPEQVAMVIAALKQGVVILIKDLNGNHVVQRCLQRLSTDDSQFIFDAAAVHCVEIATHRHGCCVLQRCVDFASGSQRHCLVAEIAANALVLSQDPFGNYVVQYILDLGMTWASVEVMVRLENHYPYLAMQKFSSNVVEKCLKLATDECRGRIVRELMGSPRLGQMLQDPYANYVVQSALTVAKGSLHSGLVEAIRPHLSVLRSSPYGKRILSRTNLKK